MRKPNFILSIFLLSVLLFGYNFVLAERVKVKDSSAGNTHVPSPPPPDDPELYICGTCIDVTVYLEVEVPGPVIDLDYYWAVQELQANSFAHAIDIQLLDPQYEVDGSESTIGPNFPTSIPSNAISSTNHAYFRIKVKLSDLIVKSHLDWQIMTNSFFNVSGQANISFDPLNPSFQEFSLAGYISGDGSVTVFPLGLFGNRVTSPSENESPFSYIQENEILNFQSFNVYPNPLSKQSKLIFHLEEYTKVSAKIINIEGKIIKDLGSNLEYLPGIHEIPLDLGELSSGLYFLRIKSGVHEETIKLVK